MFGGQLSGEECHGVSVRTEKIHLPWLPQGLRSLEQNPGLNGKPG